MHPSSGELGVLHAGRASEARTPVLLLHGGGSDSAAVSWYRLIEPLAADREVWGLDLPGFGSSIDLEPVGGPDAMADVVAEALDALGVGRAAVLGVSMGGDVALSLALHHTPRVAGLGLIGSGGLAPRVGSRATHLAAWLASRLPDPLLLPAGRLANRFARHALHAMVADPASLPDAVVDEFVRLARHPRGALGYARYNQATLARDRLTNDRTEAVQRIAVPALLFHGADDPMVDPEGSRRAARRMPRATLVEPSGCGHWAQLEAHDEFLAASRALLTEVDAAEAAGG
ncbi:alpha/beta fold hydrolase [Agrococcus terreus]|uniref:4,5-9,10-diseco-3-hydroxy-5,9, 17-trioxoandrosta-1(10),2-diene-4-oate hydrolase n=1 Tax=Agrococcus terreus TaxID=574649 RepID=A0ABQ2KJ75_9MICO|nr:alpha/beta hydrolase [Agrococcus terreus]GGN82947.1 4,5-9,10-diseco-3-hydroxy-5,9,17-trioxoandrosta-1(10),2-diene-4-oate hydrolase [Agrococcus terreus]